MPDRKKRVSLSLADMLRWDGRDGYSRAKARFAAFVAMRACLYLESVMNDKGLDEREKRLAVRLCRRYGLETELAERATAWAVERSAKVSHSSAVLDDKEGGAVL